MADEILLKNSLESTVCVSLQHFVDDHAYGKCFFTENELNTIKQKIYEFQQQGKSHSGGKYLLKQLKSVEIAKDELLKFVNNIREAIQPREKKERVSIQEVLDTEREKQIRNAMYTFKTLGEELLRKVAEAQIGEIEWKYTVDELPLVLATKQVTGKLLDPEE